MKKILALTAVALVLVASTAFGVTATATGSLSVTVGIEATISINAPTTTTLTEGAGAFAAYTGTTTLTYSVRTTKSGGDGNISLEVASDFNAGGPLAASGNLTYNCTGGSPGTACTSGQVASPTSTTPVITGFGADAHATNATATVAWILANLPSYSSGTYTASITYTISAT